MTKQDKKWDFNQYDWVQDYDDRMRSTAYLRYDETLFRVVEMSEVGQGDLVLDVGTGTGNLAVKFLEKGCKVVGLDLSTKLIKIAERKVAEWKGRLEIQLCENPFLSIPFRKNTFDVVASTFSIHHISEEGKRLSIREMKRNLKLKGRVIIGDVMFKDTADKTRALVEYRDLENEYQPTLDTFLGMFEDEGFTAEVEQVADIVYVVSARQ